MMLQQLNAEQCEEIRRFFAGAAARVLFEQLRHGWVSDWLAADNVEDREECWRFIHCVQQLEALLRDAAPNKTLNERSQGKRRVYQS
jgi:hypothetical protein